LSKAFSHPGGMGICSRAAMRAGLLVERLGLERGVEFDSPGPWPTGLALALSPPIATPGGPGIGLVTMGTEAAIGGGAGPGPGPGPGPNATGFVPGAFATGPMGLVSCV